MWDVLDMKYQFKDHFCEIITDLPKRGGRQKLFHKVEWREPDIHRLTMTFSYS